MGAATAMRIYGVEILNEGSGVSIDDAVTEMQATFVARSVDPWQAVASKFIGSVGGDSFPARPGPALCDLKLTHARGPHSGKEGGVLRSAI